MSYIISSGESSNGIILENDTMTVLDGGIAVDTRVNTDGWLHVSSGGTANSTTVNTSGIFCVSSGGTANDTTINSNCIFELFSGGTANNTTVNDGNFRVSSGGTANNTTVNDGKLFVRTGGTVNNTTVISGLFRVSSGGTATGRMVLSSGASVSAYDESTLDFDLTQTTAGTEALVNDLSIIQGTPLYTLTVDGTLADGNYKLAMKAGGFQSTISVRDTAGTQLGTLTVGMVVDIGGVDYKLTLDRDNVLSVTLDSMGAKCDIDGNGISDVMFQYTGGDQQVGFWMNGTSVWQGQGRSRSEAWNVLGAYDMNADGKADMLMTGKDSFLDMTGTMIGYYDGAVDTDDNWHTVGFLINTNDWVNEVGNLTGTKGANSIVWYAPELYALGAWTDGTDHWVSITGNFGGDAWTLVGCGDFDGDGKDSVVMSGANGAYFYAADLDGTVTSLGAANWSGWGVRAIGDFNGDGKDDLVLFHQDTGTMVMLADGSLDNFEVIGQLDAKDWFIVGCGDYDADGEDDLLVRQYSTGMLGYYASGVQDNWCTLGYGVDMNWTVIA